MDNPEQAPSEAQAGVGHATLNDSDAAAREGVLTIVDGCVALDVGTVPVFVNGEGKWDGETLRYGGDTFQIGDRVRLTGSSFEDDTGVVIPAGCDGMELWQVGGVTIVD